MSWLVAVILLGQAGSGGDFGGDQPAPPVKPRSVPVEISDSELSPPTTIQQDATVPDRPTSARFGDDQISPAPAAKWNRGPSAVASPSTIAPASAVQAATSANQASEALQAAVIRLQELLTFDESHQNEWRHVRLVEVLARNADPAFQATTISDYWDLTRAAGRARFASAKLLLLEDVPLPKDETDRAVVQAALSTAAAEEAAAQDELLAAQYRLARSSPIGWEGKLPWPADVPFVGAYRTSFETLFANRSAPLSLKYLHECLPGKLQLIERRVIAMAAAESVTDATLQSYKRGTASVTSLLQSVERLDESRQLFLNSVIDYNGRIAEYSLAAVGTALSPETLVSTLIRTAPNTAIANTTPSLLRETPTVPRDNDLREVHPASIEAPTFQPDQRIIRR